MDISGVFIYHGVRVKYESINDDVKMSVPGKTLIGADFDDAYRITTEYIERTLEYYTIHGTN